MENHVVAVRKGASAVLQNISFIIKSIETSFVNFDGPQDVIRELEGTESGGSGFKCFKDGEKLVMPNLLIYIGLFCFLGSNFRLFGIVWD